MKPVLSALGIINALGHNKDTVLSNLLSGRAPGMHAHTGEVSGREIWAGHADYPLPPTPKNLVQFDCRNNQLLLAAAEQIAPEIAAAIAAFGATRIGVVIGSSTSGIAEGEQALAEKMQSDAWPAHYHYRQQEIGSPALFLAHYLQLGSVAMTVSTACSSSAKVFNSARQLLALDLCDAVICGGSDSLCQLTLHGFSALESVSSARCEPFAEKRDGITIGEGAALFLMQKSQPQTGDIVLAGVGESADAHHISAPHPEGTGAEAAIRAALADAQCAASDIAYLNLHGTATPLNDAMESAAVHRVFGSDTPCSSTKPLTGHTLGAAGATEAGLCWLLLSAMNHQRTLPAQLNKLSPDPALAPIAILRTKQTLPKKSSLFALSNSFAFGGSNASVILQVTV